MIINGQEYRPLIDQEIIEKTDIFCNGHEVEKYNIGLKFQEKDKKYYQLYRLKE